ncbi:MAG: DUF2752 domain-containing protein [Clostridia bacterium]|nr:DUF2752 domain-containing protein [Clostridia bacterium]
MKNHSELKKYLIWGNTAVLLFTLAFVLVNRFAPFPIFCPVARLFHFYCPGCGGTRAVFALLRGQVLRSFLFHPGVLTGGLLLLYTDALALTALKKKDLSLLRFAPFWLFYCLVAVFLLQWGVKNGLLCFGIDLLGDILPR